MSLSKIYKYYKISPQKLKEILDKNSIKVDLRFIKTIPETWIEILSIETGLPKIDLNNNLPQKKEITVSDKKPKGSENDDSLKKIRNNFPPTEPKYETYFAYVKFVATDKSHAFIRIISDLNAIHLENIQLRTDNDYRITKNCEQLDFNQIILCKTNKKQHSAEIVSTNFDGYLIEDPNNRTLRKNKFHLLNHKSEPFFVDEISTKYKLITRKIFYQKKSFFTKSINLQIDYSTYLSQLKKDVESLIREETIENSTIEKAEVLKCNLPENEIDNLLKIQFDNDLQKDANFNQEEKFEKFIKKWNLLKTEWLTLLNINKLTLLTTYFKYWFDNQLPLFFWGDQLINACVQYEITYLAEQKEKSLYQSLLTKQKNLVIKSLVAFYKTSFFIDSLDIYNALINITKEVLPTQLNTYQDSIDESLSDEIKFQLWSENKTDKFPKEFSISAFEKQNEEIQIKIIKKLDEAELIGILPLINTINDKECILKLSRVSQIYIEETLNLLCFDLETDRNTIFEIAWTQKNSSKHIKNENDIPNALEELKVLITKKEILIVGHNCIDFDCVELEKKGIDFSGCIIWDTLLVEMLLSPNFTLNSVATGTF